jgi:hypothetical protein
LQVAVAAAARGRRRRRRRRSFKVPRLVEDDDVVVGVVFYS